jgi:hypothetical protein
MCFTRIADYSDDAKDVLAISEGVLNGEFEALKEGIVAIELPTQESLAPRHMAAVNAEA